MTLSNKHFNIVVIEANSLHYECISTKIKITCPKSKVHHLKQFNALRPLVKSLRQIHLVIIEQHQQQIDLELIKQLIHPSRLLVYTTHPTAEAEHAYLEAGFDHYYPKNKEMLEKLPVLIKRILRQRYQVPTKGNQFDAIKQNLKLLSHIVNHPSLGLKMGRQQWSFVEKEVEKIKKRIKNIV